MEPFGPEPEATAALGSDGSGAVGSAGSAASATGGGSARGFSADLARELGSGAGKDSKASAGSDGSGAAGRPGATAGSDASPQGSGSGTDSTAGSPGVGGGDATTPSEAAAQPTEPVAPAAAGSTRSRPRGPVKVPAGLAAIKLSLLPNWERDIDEPGTFHYVVRIKGTQSTKTFTFRYGYDDPRAPSDRDQYKRFLQDSKLMVGEIKDRQRGAAWFLEGNSPSGPAFRYVVLYGGKRLVCYGSMYKDADSNRLGDDRDQTVIQAKQICETITL